MLSHSESVAFQITQRLQPQAVQVLRDGDEVVIRYTTGRLLGSSDLKTWVEVHSGGGEFRSDLSGKNRFFQPTGP